MPVRHAFDVDPDDHCETPAEAYDDIVKTLDFIASESGRSKGGLRIYDPYFCDGAVVRNLASRGFHSVHNVNEDFYQVTREGNIPEYDVLVTNPPYSGDHLERLLLFCRDSTKPWLLLMPNYVYIKPFFETTVGEKRPFYIVPATRYEYIVPQGVRRDHTVNTAPFMSFWYAGMPPAMATKFFQWWREADLESAAGLPKPLLAGKQSEIPHNMRAQYDSSRRRLRKKQREAADRRKRKRGEEAVTERLRKRAQETCRYGSDCTRTGCWFSHPEKA